MLRAARLAVPVVLALLVGGCATPQQYLGIDTRTPLSPEDRARIEASLASGAQPANACPWPGPDGGLITVACEVMPPSLLAGLAWTANKPAALELGIRFEERRGVPRDLEKARKLYRIAVISTGGTTFYYSPGANGNAGQLIPLFAPEEPGLAEAKARLEALPPPEHGAPSRSRKTLKAVQTTARR